MPLPVRCSDSLPVPLRYALIPRVWGCVPDGERVTAIFCAGLIGTPVTEFTRDELEAYLILNFAVMQPWRLDAFRANWFIDWYVDKDVEYWRLNRAWMVNVRDARLLGCCQRNEPRCYIQTLTT